MVADGSYRYSAQYAIHELGQRYFGEPGYPVWYAKIDQAAFDEILAVIKSKGGSVDESPEPANEQELADELAIDGLCWDLIDAGLEMEVEDELIKLWVVTHLELDEKLAAEVALERNCATLEPTRAEAERHFFDTINGQIEIKKMDFISPQDGVLMAHLRAKWLDLSEPFEERHADFEAFIESPELFGFTEIGLAIIAYYRSIMS